MMPMLSAATCWHTRPSASVVQLCSSPITMPPASHLWVPRIQNWCTFLHRLHTSIFVPGSNGASSDTKSSLLRPCQTCSIMLLYMDWGTLTSRRVGSTCMHALWQGLLPGSVFHLCRCPHFGTSHCYKLSSHISGSCLGSERTCIHHRGSIFPRKVNLADRCAGERGSIRPHPV